METNNIESITIENMLKDIFTTTTVKKKKKDIVDFYVGRFGTDLFSSSPESVPAQQIAKRVEEILKSEQKKDKPYLKRGKDGKYYKTKNKPGIKPSKQDDENGNITTNYIGKAGEYAVMSELLLNGYNVNNMSVDEGIDLVASKDNIFFYIQVKTKHVHHENRFSFTIRKERYDTYIGAQIRYILVGRGIINNIARNIYFKFNNDDIKRLLHNGSITESEAGNININIEYDTHSGDAYTYNGKYRENVSYYMNNFTL